MIQKTWRPPTPQRIRHKVPENVKIRVQNEADRLIEAVLKPAHIKPPPENSTLNYIVDMYAKRHQSFFYFCAVYRCPAPNAISEFFESRFARLEYMGNERFSLSYMRHTGQWAVLLTGLTLDECLESIRDEPHYLP